MPEDSSGAPPPPPANGSPAAVAGAASAPLGFLRGALAGMVNVAATYPLNKLISRQVYEGLPVRAAWLTILEDVRQRNLFRGIAPPLLQRMLANGAMFASYDLWFHQLRAAFHGRGAASLAADRRAATDIREEAWQVRVGAAFLAGSSEWLLTPLERTQTLLQHRKYTHVYLTGREAVQAMWRVGLREFYRGGSAILLRNGPANALFFSLRDAAHDALPPAPAPAGPYGSLSAGAWDAARDFFSGAVLGAGISTLLYPLNTAKMVMQLDVGTRHKSILETLAALVQQRGGVAGLYRGVWLNSLRSLLSWGITNTTCVPRDSARRARASFAYRTRRSRTSLAQL
jgi:hypothetical protein